MMDEFIQFPIRDVVDRYIAATMSDPEIWYEMVYTQKSIEIYIVTEFVENRIVIGSIKFTDSKPRTGERLVADRMVNFTRLTSYDGEGYGFSNWDRGSSEYDKMYLISTFSENIRYSQGKIGMYNDFHGCWLTNFPISRESAFKLFDAIYADLIDKK